MIHGTYIYLLESIPAGIGRYQRVQPVAVDWRLAGPVSDLELDLAAAGAGLFTRGTAGGGGGSRETLSGSAIAPPQREAARPRTGGGGRDAD